MASGEDQWSVLALLSESKVPAWWDLSKYFITFYLLDLLFENCVKVSGSTDDLLSVSISVL